MNLFSPDTILPDQYWEEHSRDSGIRRERRLMLAVLRDALESYQKYALARDPRGREMFADAVEWIESHEREWPFSFENICEVLALDAEYVRHGLSKWRRKKTPSARRPPRIVPLVERRRTDAEPDRMEQAS